MPKYTKILTTHPNTRSAGHIFPESKDLCPLCNWDEACLVGLGCEWMLPILLFHPGRVCCFGPVPCIVSFSSSPSSTWLPFCRFFIPQTSLAFAGCLEHTAMVHSCFFTGHPRALCLHTLPFSLPFPFELHHVIPCCGELPRGQVVETEGADGKLDNPRLARRSLLED